MKTTKFVGIAALSCAIVVAGCKHNTLIDLTNPTVTVDCDPDTVYFQNDVLPLLISNCAMSGCHDGIGRIDEKAPLSSYEDVMSSGYVKAFDANDSKLIEAVTDGGEDFMPPSPNEPLSNAQIALLEKWINQGARNNACEGGDCDTTAVTYSGKIVKIIDTYCLGCHNSTTTSSGIDLSSYSGVADIAADGSFLGTIMFEFGYVGMPYNGNPIPDCKIDEIRIWIENGYLND
ncbi:MAG: hypothetical protein V9F05_19285 [Chitinophagaceae bacterium]